MVGWHRLTPRARCSPAGLGADHVDRGQTEPGVPPRPSRRLDYIDQALAPLRERLTTEEHDRLVHAMALVIGIEARIVLRDICDLDDGQVIVTERWAAHALIAAVLK